MTQASILIVEDESVVALDLKLQLLDWGYDVVGVADTAAQAESLAQLHRPDLALMDVMLQGEVDGIEAALHLQGSLGVPVLFLTSYSDADTVRRAAETAAYGYVTKPFQARELHAGIEVAIWKAKMERQLAELAGERMKRQASELASRSKSEFLARISHEMRTPLNAVLGFAQLLKHHEISGTPPTPGYPDHILNAGRHLLALVDDVLDVQGVADGTLRLSLQPCRVDLMLHEVAGLLQPMAAPRDVRLQPEGLAPVVALADPTRLRQVLLNLGTNAVKYNVQGGSVRLAASQQSGQVRVSVEDTGIGMTPEQLAHLFEPFNRLGRESTREDGVGLGLVIARRLAGLMQGTLRVESEAGVGTRATLELPEVAE